YAFQGDTDAALSVSAYQLYLKDVPPPAVDVALSLALDYERAVPETPPDLPPANVAPALSYALDIEPLFVENCSDGCHIAGGFGGPDGAATDAAHTLALGLGYDSLTKSPSQQVAMPLVGATPEDSYLLYKLTASQSEVGGSGLSMPYGSTLSDDEVA